MPDRSYPPAPERDQVGRCVPGGSHDPASGESTGHPLASAGADPASTATAAS